MLRVKESVRLIKRYVCFFVILVLVAIGSYYWGYLCGEKCGEQSANYELYDKLLVDIANNILIHDALVDDDAEKIMEFHNNLIVFDFIKMIGIYEKNKYERGEYIRCVVTRRLRELINTGQIIIKEEDFPLESINTYLSKECLGKPSHTNWNRT